MKGKFKIKQKKEKFIMIAFILCISGGVIGSAHQIYTHYVKKAVLKVERKDNAHKQIDEERMYEQTVKELDEDYEEEYASMNGDDTLSSVSNVDSGEAEMICQNLFDSDGSIIWKGLTKEELDNADESVYQDFQRAYDEWCEQSLDETDDTVLNVDTSGNAYERLMELCYDYNETIPFAGDEYSYNMGFFKQEDGYNNLGYVKEGQNGSGLCSMGYVVWTMRNVFGYTPKGLKGKKINTKHTKEVYLNELNIGDICVSNENVGKRYGIVAGFYDNHPVVSLCDNVCSVKFPCGSNHYVFIKDENDKNIGNYPAVDFDIFYRLDEKWGGSDE